MTTPAFTQIDVTKPTVAGTRQVGIDAIRNNGAALVYYIISGRANGWTLTTASNVEEPTYRLWTNGTESLKATFTYTAGYVTQIVWAWSNDSGGSYTTIFTETATYNSTHQTGGANSSHLSWLYEWIGKFKDLRALFTAHNGGAVGTYHSGIGTIASQAAASIAITGGSIKGTTVGGTGASEAALGTFLNAREKFVDCGSVSGAFNVDVSLGSWFRMNPTGGYTPTIINAPAANFTQVLVFEIVDGVGHAMTLTGMGTAGWGAAGAPTFSANTDYVNVISRDGFSTTRLIMGSKG